MSKLPHIGTTIFTVMSKLAADTNAINLSQGFPNFPVDQRLTDLLAKHAHNDVHQYRPMPGSSELIQEIQGLVQRQYHRSVHSEEVLVTAGATQGIFTAIMALVRAGDEVLILDPSYDSYEPSIRLAGGKAIRIPLNNAFLPDWDRISEAVTERTKMIITNNPHNPSGRVWDAEDLESIQDLLKRNEQLIWLSDEVYEFITFEKQQQSAHACSSFHDRIIVTSSFGKTFHITGWKMGYVVAPKQLMEEIKKVHQFNVFSVNSVSQVVLADYLKEVNVNELGPFYQQKRDTFQALIKESRFKLLPCEGTYFQTVNYASISNLSDIEFCRELAIKHGVAAIPISVFTENGLDNKTIRFCFAKDDLTLQKASEKLCKI